MKDLPKVFASKIDKEINNSQRTTIVNNNLNIDDILKENIYPFNHKYLIILKDKKQIQTSIISKNDDYILTIDSQKININDIESITKIKM